VGLTGCASVSKNVAFDGTDGSSFALLAAKGIHNGINYHFVFQKVNRDTSTFSADKFGLSVSPDAGTLFETPEQLGTDIYYSGKAVPPGEYALIARFESSAYFTSSEGSACYTEGAGIIRIRKGQIQIIPVGPGNSSGTRDPAALEAEVEAVMAAYPNMVAPISVAPTVGNLTFESTEPGKCIPKGPFTLTE
jgi:hypothetical protein